MDVIGYAPALREHFLRLNLVWIERHFEVEPHDIEQLEDPEGYILESGGQVLFAIAEHQVVGTCAIIQTGPAEFELAKMAVDDAFQGRGIGQALGEAAIAWAKDQGATKLWLESNRKLHTALRLYERLGFHEVPLADTPYARADIKMEMDLI